MTSARKMLAKRLTDDRSKSDGSAAIFWEF